MFLLACAATGPAAAGPLALSDIKAISIHDGINIIDHFAADGRAATIVQAFRDNGNAHGHYVYLVLLPVKIDRSAPAESGVVAFDEGERGLSDTIGVSPFDGERVLGTIRFAHAMLDGTPATVAIRADLVEGLGGVAADHAPVDISVYKLEHPGIEIGETPDVFRLLEKSRAEGRFCNADMALATVLHLPLPADYAGGNAPGGCL